MQERGCRARPAVEHEGQRPVRRSGFRDVGGVKHRRALLARLVIKSERAGGRRISELAAQRID
jgi:hypothetical protein